MASIDFPLHGERASAKLSELLISGLAGRGRVLAPDALALWGEFARQSVADLSGALDALTTLDAIDSGRLAYAGFSMGAFLGALFCSSDPRPRAAALALGGAGLGPPDLDPAAHVGRFAPRPLLLVNATRDERVSRAAAEALHAAAGEPKQIAWFECGHTDLPGAALKTMWAFLARELGVPSP